MERHVMQSFLLNSVYSITLQVISVKDCSSIYSVPILLEEQNLIPLFNERLQLKLPNPSKRMLFKSKWRDLALRYVCAQL